jgi:hypothetical protein
MSDKPDDATRRTPDGPTKKGRGCFQGSPKSLKNLKRGNQPSEREAQADAAEEPTDA